MAEEQQSNIRQESAFARVGLNMDVTPNQVQKGVLTYALNAAVENYDASSVNYQNEPGNEFCLNFPTNYLIIGHHFINEQNKHIFFLANPLTGDSQIGYMDNNDCVYRVYINAKCLNFNINYPIHKAVHKITNCTTEVYWTDGLNPRRYLDLNKIPYRTTIGDTICDVTTYTDIDCNKLNIQPDFSIPSLDVKEVINVGNLTAGTYQFAVQYCDIAGDAYTSYYSVTNPTPIANPQLITPDFDYKVGKAIVVSVNNIDVTGYFQYFNLAVIKTINGVTSVELVGTYFIDDTSKEITYTGQQVDNIRLTTADIFEKFPYYEIAQDITSVQDVLVWDNLTSISRINYQQIANQITLQWQSYKLPANETYANELNATDLRGYLRDEVYAFEIVFLLANGKQTDGFHIPGRAKNQNEFSLPDIPDTNADFIGAPDYYVGSVGYSPYWKIYNTAYVLGPGQGGPIDNATPYEYGDFAYWESTETYPCNEDQWGDLSGQPIRHHKMPDVLVSPIFESGTPSILLPSGKYDPASLVMADRAVYPLGVKFDPNQVKALIESSNLTREQKDEIVGFKIVRGDRSTNQSIVGKGILRNVGKYRLELNDPNSEYYFPNYPYNDLKEDPFLLEENGSYNAQCRSIKFYAVKNGTLTYISCITGKTVSRSFTANEYFEICSLGVPTYDITQLRGCGNYEVTNVSGIAAIVQIDACGYGALVFTLGPGKTVYVCSCKTPLCTNTLITTKANPTYYTYILTSSSSTTFAYIDAFSPITLPSPGIKNNITVTAGNPVTITSLIYPEYVSGDGNYTITQSNLNFNPKCYPGQLDAFNNSQSGYRHVFNSPETSFGQPFLGTVLKLENALYGKGKGHFVEVKKHAYYKLLTKEAQEDALLSSFQIASITTGPSDVGAAFAAYQSYLQIYINGITRKNYTNSYNSIAKYSYSSPIQNNLQVKQRPLDIAVYLTPGVQNVGDDNNINNYQRESSVYLRTDLTRTSLPYPSNTPSLLVGGVTPAIEDKSRYTISTAGTCGNPEREFDIESVLYYASLKLNFVNQWGAMYSYDTIDTGYQANLRYPQPPSVTVFGGDTFINKFSFKTKLPFFIDNRVNAPDDSDVFYDEIYNIAYPKYFFSSRSILFDYSYSTVNLSNIISTKAHFFDCPNSQYPPTNNPGRTYYDGDMYLFAYGIPTFYCESSINVDLRQAFNGKDGDFFPRVSSGIPDDWLQESVVPIAFDNSYYYNVTYSKQNKENFFSHLPIDWKDQLCYTNFPFRAIYSDRQQSFVDNRINSWLIYRPISFFDFPQNYGKLTSLDGIQNRAVMARFENKSLLYNTLLTVETSNPQAAYLGNDTLFRSAPPIDFAETDLGFVGCQNKMFLKIPQGQITVDAKRGQIFLIQGSSITDLASFGKGLNRFLTDHLAFEILRYFPNVNVDNHFNGVGLHGVYDSKYDRVIITKLDYIPQNEWVGKIKYDSVTQTYYIEKTYSKTEPDTIRETVNLTDGVYFCNKSWTLSYNMNTQSWISFHSYIPNFYVAENNFFYSGSNQSCDLEAIAFEDISLDCRLEGTADSFDCRLAGTAESLEPSTSTTTSTSSSTTSTTSSTTTFVPGFPCGTPMTYLGGPTYPTENYMNLGNAIGPTQLNFQAYNVPDRFIVEWNGNVVIDTGYRGDADYDFGGTQRAAFQAGLIGRIDPILLTTYPDLVNFPDDGYPRVTSPGNGSVSFTKTLAVPVLATVDVYGPMPTTLWDYTLNCPVPTPIQPCLEFTVENTTTFSQDLQYQDCCGDTIITSVAPLSTVVVCAFWVNAPGCNVTQGGNCDCTTTTTTSSTTTAPPCKTYELFNGTITQQTAYWVDCCTGDVKSYLLDAYIGISVCSRSLPVGANVTITEVGDCTC